MNPLMNALRLAEQARPAPTACRAEGAPGPAASGGRRLEPIRATRDDTGPDAMPPTARGVDEPSGREAGGWWQLEPVRATRDDTKPETVAAGLDPVEPERMPPVHSMPSGKASTSTAIRPGGRVDVEGVADAAGVTSSGAFDPRILSRRHGIGRLIGIALSLFAVIGAGAGGGYFIWKTEFVRPALLRHLPPMPVAAMEPAPVQAPGAAMGVAGESARATAGAAAAALGTVVHPVASTQGSAEPSSGPLAGRAGSVGRDRPRDIREPAPAVPTMGPIAQAPAGASAEAAELPVPAMEHAGVEPQPSPGAGIEIRKRIRADHVTASLGRAYAALLAGDAESAAESYRAVLGHEPGNRDAVLGLAAVAARAGRWDEAAGHYARILASLPSDTVARAALIAIAEQDPARGESRLKALLWSEPRAAHLHFNLGNVYAAQSRWAEAQQSYFNAYRFDRRNADYAYNLAVSLDHLSQPGSALGLYREALDLSRSRPASFETEVVRRRIRDLDTSAGTDFTSARPATEAATAPAARPR